MAKPKSDRKGPRIGGLRGLLDRISGARLCFGEPVTSGGRTVIPVARVRTAGGWGWGSGDERDRGGTGSGGGGGGFVEAKPAGFIEFDDAGARYHAIPDPDRLANTVKALAGAAVTLSTAFAGAKALQRVAKPRRLRGAWTRRLLPR
jgi:uncharacterized spore protein YtfJ